MTPVEQMHAQIASLRPLLRLLPPSAQRQALDHVDALQALRIDESAAQDSFLDPDDWKGGEPAESSPIKNRSLREAIFDWDAGIIDGAELLAIAGSEKRRGRWVSQ